MRRGVFIKNEQRQRALFEQYIKGISVSFDYLCQSLRILIIRQDQEEGSIIVFIFRRGKLSLGLSGVEFEKFLAHQVTFEVCYCEFWGYSEVKFFASVLYFYFHDLRSLLLNLCHLKINHWFQSNILLHP